MQPQRCVAVTPLHLQFKHVRDQRTNQPYLCSAAFCYLFSSPRQLFCLNAATPFLMRSHATDSINLDSEAARAPVWPAPLWAQIADACDNSASDGVTASRQQRFDVLRRESDYLGSFANGALSLASP